MIQFSFSIGRRWCLFLYSVSCGFTLSCILVIHVIKAMNTNVDMMLGITIFGKLGVTSTIFLILLVTLEVYPTSIRWVIAGMKAYWYLQQLQAAVDVVIEWFLLQMHGLCRRSFIRDRGTMSGAFYTFWVLQCECKFTYWKKLLRLLFIIMKRFIWNIRADLLISIQSYMYSFIYFLLLLEKPIFLSIYLLRRYDGVSRLCLFAVPGDFR